jgi:hypothetical protein
LYIDGFFVLGSALTTTPVVGSVRPRLSFSLIVPELAFATPMDTRAMILDRAHPRKEEAPGTT